MDVFFVLGQSFQAHRHLRSDETDDGVSGRCLDGFGQSRQHPEAVRGREAENPGKKGQRSLGSLARQKAGAGRKHGRNQEHVNVHVQIGVRSQVPRHAPRNSSHRHDRDRGVDAQVSRQFPGRLLPEVYRLDPSR